MDVQKDNPDLLPHRFSILSSEKSKGKLRIYLGYAAGVGKTCAMLSDAQEARKDGIDVVAGYIEPHARPETMALLEGMECLPPLEVKYKGVSLRELDLDFALKRKPALILVDELAHSNASGCRHKKRYQDVDELLRAGIDVYTTVNVQHIESLHDLVASITGISVHERIPDSVFDSADQIEVVDIEPDDLIARLNKGKIYQETQARKALENFFTKEKLIALREIALRRTADQVTRAAAQTTTQRGSEANRPHGNEHILTCLSAAPSSAKVIRTAARMATALHGAFSALFVETPATKDLDDKSASQLRDNLRLAEQLGAQIATVYGESVPEQIAQYAKVSGITKIVMGRSAHGKRWFAKPNFVDRLTELAPNLDIYIIPDTQPSQPSKLYKTPEAPQLSIKDTAKSLAGLAVCTLVGLWFRSLGFDEANIITVYILGVLLNSVLTESWVYGAAYSVLSVLAFNYFFTEPSFTLDAYGTGYPVTFAVMLSAALMTSALTKRVKMQARQAAEKAYHTEVLLETNRKLEQAGTQTDILNETAHQLLKLLGRTVIVYPTGQHSLAEPLVFTGNDGIADTNEYLCTEERAVAEWVFKNNKRAGATTNTLPAAKCLYLAIRSGGQVLAVIGIAMDENPLLEPFEKSLMIAMLGECAMALERQRADEAGRQVAMEAEQERLRANLLRAISHDLRTPLTSISGNAAVLMNNTSTLNEAQKTELYSDIYDDSMWLNNLVENLLAITRIENGNASLDLQPDLLSDVIDEALLHINRKSAEHHIKTHITDELLMAKMDARLIVQVIINMVDNAIKYTQTGSNITITAVSDGVEARIEVADDGPGIRDEAKVRIFDMFYTANNGRADGRRGLGLGLYLCKSIIAAHGGEIYVKDNTPKGTIFGFSLQAQEVHLHE